MSIFNKLISLIIPFIPKSLTYLFAKRYVAGTTKETAFSAVKQLNNDGYMVTLDILGEHVKDRDAAKDISDRYIDLYYEIDKRKLNCNISIKPSHIGADIDNEIFNTNLKSIIEACNKTNSFLRIDMESSRYTDLTIQTFKKFKVQSKNIGTVFQAYLHRTLDDIMKLDTQNLNFRLCKGIYKESEEIAITDRIKINDNYIKILRYTFENNIYVAIATHDTSLLQLVYNLIKEMNIDSDRFEFQTLYGVPMHGWNQKHLDSGYRVRVYVPFGEDWYKYSVRRLKENPDIAGYIIKNLFSK